MGDESAPAFVTDMPEYLCLQQLMSSSASNIEIKENKYENENKNTNDMCDEDHSELRQFLEDEGLQEIGLSLRVWW